MALLLVVAIAILLGVLIWLCIEGAKFQPETHFSMLGNILLAMSLCGVVLAGLHRGDSTFSFLGAHWFIAGLAMMAMAVQERVRKKRRTLIR